MSVALKQARLAEIIRGYRSALVCYSGGIDSLLVLKVATDVLGPRAIGMTAVSPSLPRGEREAARRFARAIGADHREVDSHELKRPGYANNGPDRCFHCKSELYTIAHEMAERWGVSVICNGTNLDDLGDYRPGLVAAKDAGVRSPLLEAELKKADVRDVAEALGLEAFDKPASACLSSRIPYGTRVTPERLSQIEEVETVLHRLGFPQVRVRAHGDIARIEVSLDALSRLALPEFREPVLAAGLAAGFRAVTLDLAGYRSGSLNETLGQRRLPMVDTSGN